MIDTLLLFIFFLRTFVYILSSFSNCLFLSLTKRQQTNSKPEQDTPIEALSSDKVEVTKAEQDTASEALSSTRQSQRIFLQKLLKAQQKETRLQSKQMRKIADGGGAQWFEDSKKLTEIDSLQFVL